MRQGDLGCVQENGYGVDVIETCHPKYGKGNVNLDSIVCVCLFDDLSSNIHCNILCWQMGKKGVHIEKK